MTQTIWKAVLQEQFGEQLSLIQWQQNVADLTHRTDESLQQYAFAKLKILSRCPVVISDKERIEYLVQGICDDQVATSIAVQQPRTVDDFLKIVSEVEYTWVILARPAIAHRHPRDKRKQLAFQRRTQARIALMPLLHQKLPARILPTHHLMNGKPGRKSFPQGTVPLHTDQDST